MRRAVFVLWGAVALSQAASGQPTTQLAPGVAAQGHLDGGGRASFGFYANPGGRVMIRLLSLSQDYSLQFTVSWSYSSASFPQIVNPHLYTIPSSIPGNPPTNSVGPSGVGVTFAGEYDLPGGSQGSYNIAVFSGNQAAGDFLLVYTNLTGKCPSSSPSCNVVPLNCGVPAVNQQIGSPPPPKVVP